MAKPTAKKRAIAPRTDDEETSPPPHAKRLRGKSQEKKEYDAAHEYSTFQMKLSSILHKGLPNDIRNHVHQMLDDTSFNLTRIGIEAYAFANYHVLRLLQGGLIPPKLDQSFFYACCAAMTDTSNAPKDEDLRDSLSLYLAMRPSSNYTVACNKYMGNSLSILAKEMETCAINHIVENFPNRLRRYVEVRYGMKRNVDQLLRMLQKPESDVEKQLVAWLDPPGPLREKQTYQKHVSHFLGKLYDIMVWYDEQPADAKGIRRFSLLPTKGSFVQAFHMVSESTLTVLLRTLDRPIQERIVIGMQVLVESPEYRAFLDSRLTSKAVFCDMFHQNKNLSRALWYYLFDVMRFETATRKFAFKISTNGYAATVYMQKPKASSTLEAVALPVIDISGYKTFIGIDPGSKFLATAYDGQNVRQVSAKEYRTNAKIVQRRQWDVRFRQRNLEYAETIRVLESLKTANLAKFESGIRTLLAHVESLMEISRVCPFRKWRFKVSVYSKKALDQLAKKIIGNTVSKNEVCIGLGDWSQQDGFLKGCEKAPVKRLRDELKKHVKVVMIDEHKSSQVCSQCQAATVRYVRYRKVDRETNEVQLSSCYQVVRCRNNECSTCFQRDLNGARNIYSLLLAIRDKASRPLLLQRRMTARKDNNLG